MPTRSEGVRPSAAATSFVGRSRQLDEVATLVTENRVTTVTGPGGVGKTRLALEFAARAGERFSGIFLVDLAPVRKPAEVVAAVARTVGVTDQSNRSPSEKIVTVLEDRTALLILDNCEHVLGSVADLVAELLDRLPELRFLITSRTALAITEEYRYPVPRLTVPPVTTAATMEQLQAYESVQLLVDRARAAVPGFAPPMPTPATSRGCVCSSRASPWPSNWPWRGCAPCRWRRSSNDFRGVSASSPSAAGPPRPASRLCGR